MYSLKDFPHPDKSFRHVMFRNVCKSELDEWVINDLLRATLKPEDYQTKLHQTQPKYIFIKPESLCHADPRWKIQHHESKPKYVYINNVSSFGI